MNSEGRDELTSTLTQLADANDHSLLFESHQRWLTKLREPYEMATRNTARDGILVHIHLSHLTRRMGVIGQSVKSPWCNRRPSEDLRTT